MRSFGCLPLSRLMFDSWMSLGCGGLELRHTAGDGPCGCCMLHMPHGVPEADQGDSCGKREQPFVLRHDAGQDGCHAAASKEYRGPPGEDVGAEECDAEEEAAGEVGDPVDEDGDLDQPDTAGDGTVCGSGDGIADVGGRTVRYRGKDKGTDEFNAEHRQIPGGEGEVPDQAEHADLLHLEEVHTDRKSV